MNNKMLKKVNSKMQKCIKYAIYFSYNAMAFFRIKRLMKACEIPWRATAIFCDGSITCYCADHLKAINLGNVLNKSFDDLWNGNSYKKLRKTILNGYMPSYICVGCQWNIKYLDFIKRGLNEMAPIDNLKRAFIEPTIRCNIRCYGCRVNEAMETRESKSMNFVQYQQIINQIGSQLRELYLYLGGETFANKDIYKILKYTRNNYPHISIVIHTNGLLLDDKEKRNTVLETCSFLTFSVDGASQESYSPYRSGGDFNVVKDNMLNLIKERNELGLTTPKIIWKYILFKWNDSDSELDRARALAKDIGVDELRWQKTVRPITGISIKYTIFRKKISDYRPT